MTTSHKPHAKTGKVVVSRFQVRHIPPKTTRGNKAETLRFRVDPRQKEYWQKAMAELGIPDFSTYARAAIDRAIQQDLRSSDPKWQEFIKAIQPQANAILGMEVSDKAQDRIESPAETAEIEAVLKRHRNK